MPMLLLDPRLGSGDLYDLLPRAETELVTLEDAEHRGIGDVASSGYDYRGPITWGMEIKRLGDALQSLQDGRLPASQLPRMHEHWDYVFLLIEEDIRVSETGYLQKRVRKQNARTHKWSEYWADVVYGAREKVLARDLYEWLISLHVCGGARLLRSGGRADTAAWVKAVWRFFAKPWSEHKSLKVFDDSHPPRFVVPSKAAKVARVLADGVGWEKAMSVGEHLGSAEAVVCASVDELKAVDGIGDELAARIFHGARERHQHVEKRGGRNASRTARPHSDVLPAPGGGAASKRRAHRGKIPGPHGPADHHRTGKRK